jgi:PAS domain S-box-containing protein
MELMNRHSAQEVSPTGDQPATSVRGASLRMRLVALVMAGMLPALILGAVAVWRVAVAQQAATEADLRNTANSLALAVERELRGAETALIALAASPTLTGQVPDLAAFRHHAEAVGRDLGGWIVLEGQDRQQLINTRVAADVPLPTGGAPDLSEHVFNTGTLGVSGPFVGPVAQQLMVAIGVPVRGPDGAVRYLLAKPFSPASLSALLGRHPLMSRRTFIGMIGPDGLTDRKVIIARWPDPNDFVGLPASPWYARGVEGRAEGVLRGKANAGWNVVLGFARVPLAADWVVGVALPADEVDTVLRGPAKLLAGGAILAIMVSVGLVTLMARSLVRPIRALAAGVPADSVSPSGIPEIESMRQSLSRAQAAARQHTIDMVRVARADAQSEMVARFKLFGEASPDALWMFNVDTWKLEYISPAVEEFCGVPRADLLSTAHGWTALIHIEDRERGRAMWRTALAGKASREEYRIVRPDNGETRWIRDRAFPIMTTDGKIVGVGGIARDVTSEKIADAQQGLLLREVNHRAKNALAVVRSVIHLTRADTMADYIKLVDSRVASIALAQSLLADGEYEGADLRAVAQTALEPFDYVAMGATRFLLNGPAVIAPGRMVQPLSMALHELATNAAKYGALSRSEGRVHLHWQMLVPEGMLRMIWTEVGGPQVVQPQRRGFGSRVLEGTIRHQLWGTVVLRWEATGLICEMELPLRPTAADHVPTADESRLPA